MSAILDVMKRGISSKLPVVLREARLILGMTQQSLANAAGCKQSAVSMFEGGRLDALSMESIMKLAETLGVDLSQYIDATSQSGGLSGDVSTDSGGVLFCPNFLCPSNTPYTVCGSVFFMPSGRAGAGERCVCCGEILVSACPHCGAPIRTPGGCCGTCGKALVDFPDEFASDPVFWAARRASEIRSFFPAGNRFAEDLTPDLKRL